MWTIFSLENLFFAIHVFAGLTLFAVAWLYFDAWKETKINREILKIIGFIILGSSFLIRGVEMREIEILQNIDIYTRIIGYLVLIIALVVDPLQPKPKNRAIVFFSTVSLFFLSPILASVVAILYLRRASIGLERHLYPPAISFFAFSIYELVFSLKNFRETDNLNIFNLLAPYGTVWLIMILLLTSAILFIGRWVFRYLLKQFQSQLFMVLMSLVLCIYLIVTVGFTGLLLNNLKSQILQELSSQSKVLEFAFNAKKAETLATAKLLSKSDTSELEGSDLSTNYNFLVFDENGVVTFRNEDNERKGDSISGDKLVKRVLSGKNDSNIVVSDGVVAPTITIVSGSPIINGEKVIGGVLVEEVIDDLYLEGFSKTTNLKAAVYGGNILSAGGQIGILENNETIKDKVLTKGETYALENKWLNRRFLSVYAPLKDVEGNTIGMYFVGRPQAEVLEIASKTLEMVFLGTIILLLLSMVPAKLIANNITKQLT
jgi:hypothetical protein